MVNYDNFFTPLDQRMSLALADFLPPRIYDFHLHFYDGRHYRTQSWAPRVPFSRLGVDDWRTALAQNPVFRERQVGGLAFGLPAADSDQPAINRFIREETRRLGSSSARALLLAAPQDDPAAVEAALRSGQYHGLKVYHCYAARADTFNAEITEYAPEWMWRVLNQTGGVMMLHLVLPRAIADPRNQRVIREFCQRYPDLQLVLAHVARCFNHRHALEGLSAVADLPNVWVDTSAVCEAQSFLEALRVLGPGRILYGSDYFVSELRGRCLTLADGFYWHPPQPGQPEDPMTKVGIESLRALHEAYVTYGARRGDIEDLFWNNAMRCLRIKTADAPVPLTPAETWREARGVIAGGTGLLSKRAESFLTPEWPVTYSRAEGCRVWGGQGRRYRDFVGGVGAVLLGYADPAVNAAVGRRLAQGSYCSLVATEEVELARRLLALHPGMGKVRYARGGGEAMAMAVRIARAATGKNGIVFCGYHGWHDWYLAANVGYEVEHYPIPGLSPRGVPAQLAGTARSFHYNDLASLQRACAALEGDVAAIVMEPVRSQSPTPEFIAAVTQAVKTSGALLVMDEVTSGLRYGFPGVARALGFDPDLVVYAKAMSNGIPFGAVVGREVPMTRAEASFISSSYWTDGLGPAAALAVLDKMEREAIQPALWRRGEDFSAALRTVLARFPACQPTLIGMPVSPALHFRCPSSPRRVHQRLIEEMLRRGFLVGTILYLMHAHTDEDLQAFLHAMEESLQVVEGEQIRGELSDEDLPAAPAIGRLA